MTISSSLRRWRFGVSAFLLLTLVACRGGGDDNSEAVGELKIPPMPKTIKPELIVSGLDKRIGMIKLIITKQVDPYSQNTNGPLYVSALLERAHFFGRVSDFETALVYSEQLITKHGEQFPRLYIVRARVLAAVHRFDDAARALDKAAAGKGVTELELLPSRVSIWLATNEVRKAWEALREPSKKKPTKQLAFLTAVSLADLGEAKGAEAEFIRAMPKRTDGAPQPIVRTLFHWGRMWEREGKRSRARRLYQAAHKKLPQYAPLAAHLAGLEAEAGNTKRAIEILEPVVAISEDPEHKGQLGELLAKTDAERSAKLIAEAKTEYEALLQTQWRAFADHAARFYLGPGGDAARAFELAKRNIENRKADEAYQLYFDAAAAVKDTSPSTCELAAEAAKLAEPSAYALFAAGRALKACGDEAGAKAAMKRADKAKRAR